MSDISCNVLDGGAAAVLCDANGGRLELTIFDAEGNGCTLQLTEKAAEQLTNLIANWIVPF